MLIIKKRITGSILILVLILTGCVFSSPDFAGEDVFEKTTIETTGESDSISWMSWLHVNHEPSDEVVKALSELVGENIEFEWYSNLERNEILNTVIASKNFTDVLTLTQISTNTVIRGAVEEGLFWDIEPFLKDYPNLAAISKDRIDSARISGKLYGIPLQKPYARYGLIIRKDWLDNLGLPPPKTFDDIMEIARAFTEDDPDGNGINDTVGLVEREEFFEVSFRIIAGYFGAPNYFSIEKSDMEAAPVKVNSYFQHEGFYKAAEKIRELYLNGYMNSDWVIMQKDEQRKTVAGGRGGMAFITLTDSRMYNKDAVDLKAQTEWVLCNDITVEGVERRVISDTNNGFGGLLVIPKNTVSKERLPKILSMLDKLNSEEAFALMTYGIEGLHYKMTPRGTYETINEDKWVEEVQPLNHARPNDLWYYKMLTENELDRQALVLFNDNEQYAVLNDCQSLNSETHLKDWSRLMTIVQNAYSNYVMGNIDMNSFKSEIDRWLDEGGQKMIDEYEADYARLK